MSQNHAVQTGRDLLQTAHAATQSGVDVFVHAIGTPPLEATSIAESAPGATCATIRCWSSTKGKYIVWCVPLANVLAVEIGDDWPL